MYSTQRSKGNRSKSIARINATPLSQDAQATEAQNLSNILYGFSPRARGLQTDFLADVDAQLEYESQQIETLEFVQRTTERINA
jgi:hypothetical protein